MDMDISLVWAGIIFFSVMMYVVMDGFDLGIGILYPFVADRYDRDVMMNTVAPVWDGNETWLVLGGAGLLAAFPLAYAVVLSALYLPLIFMLLGLIFRGVAFEFRFKALDHERHIWDKAFIGGSIVAAFFQGVALGAYINGIPVVDRAYAGGAMDWLTPFSLFTGVGVVVAYSLLGSTWLIMKTEGELKKRMIQITVPLAWLVVAMIVAVSIWTPLAFPGIAERWFKMPNMLYLSPIPLLVALSIFLLMQELRKGSDVAPFLTALALIFLGYIGLSISIWPNIIPPDISIWAAAAPRGSQIFTLVGTVIIIPIILIYTVWAYYVFRGKVRHGDGYH
ncbi:MAG: cytochrome d ubiquinol oxidase subunit II [Pseudomonadota bacterium]